MKKLFLAAAMTCFAGSAYSADILLLDCWGVIEFYDILERDQGNKPIKIKLNADTEHSFKLFVNLDNRSVGSWSAANINNGENGACHNATITNEKIFCTQLQNINSINIVTVYDINRLDGWLSIAQDSQDTGHRLRDGASCKESQSPAQKPNKF
jgi:hypothetical protein